MTLGHITQRNHNESALLSKLPPEIRTMVWKEVFTVDDALQWGRPIHLVMDSKERKVVNPHKITQAPILPALLTCASIYFEAATHYYTKHLFHFGVSQTYHFEQFTTSSSQIRLNGLQNLSIDIMDQTDLLAACEGLERLPNLHKLTIFLRLSKICNDTVTLKTVVAMVYRIARLGRLAQLTKFRLRFLGRFLNMPEAFRAKQNDRAKRMEATIWQAICLGKECRELGIGPDEFEIVKQNNSMTESEEARNWCRQTLKQMYGDE